MYLFRSSARFSGKFFLRCLICVYCVIHSFNVLSEVLFLCVFVIQEFPFCYIGVCDSHNMFILALFISFEPFPLRNLKVQVFLHRLSINISFSEHFRVRRYGKHPLLACLAVRAIFWCLVHKQLLLVIKTESCTCLVLTCKMLQTKLSIPGSLTKIFRIRFADSLSGLLLVLLHHWHISHSLFLPGCDRLLSSLSK